jgi:hypothetical protein
VSDLAAVLAVDPGGITGVAYGELMLLPTVRDTLRESAAAGLVEAWEVEGLPELQAHELAAEVRERVGDWIGRGGEPASFSLVIESFALRQSRVELQPVGIALALRALLIDPAEVGSLDGWTGTYAGGIGVYEQEPSTAMTYATRERLKEWGLWDLGRSSRDHRRDALRHLATRTAALLESRTAAGGATSSGSSRS